MAREKKIIIVGAGLVGSLLALYLRKRGYAVSVYERRADIRKSSVYAGRSINLALSTRGIKSLEEVGLSHAINTEAIPMHGRMMHDIQGNLSFLAYGLQGQFINSISRSALNILLLDEAEKSGVQFHFDHWCTHVDLNNTSLDFKVGDHVVRQSADIIIGADGAYSSVRMAMQVSDRFDFSQDYIDHGYKELHIPPSANGGFQMEKNALHIWPRESFMLIALPNPDGSFTCTLFFPFKGKPSFESVTTDEEIRHFFKQTFPDVYGLIPSLESDFRHNPTSSLVTMQCFPWVKNNTLLLGDAAHAIVPFYGQGMNAGFEDCRVLNQLLDDHNDDWSSVMAEFQSMRKPDADAIAKLALDNFVEMRDLVGDPDFLLRKKIEATLQQRFPGQWTPLYSMVTFDEKVRYSEALRIGQKQKAIMDNVMMRPDIHTTWETLDFEAIVAQLSA